MRAHNEPSVSHSPTTFRCFVVVLGLALAEHATGATPGDWCDAHPFFYVTLCEASCYCTTPTNYRVPCSGARANWAYCDGRVVADHEECHCDEYYSDPYYEWARVTHPEYYDIAKGCAEQIKWYGPLPAEICGDEIDQNCNGIAEACPGCTSPYDGRSYAVAQTAACPGFSSSQWPQAFRNSEQCHDGTMRCQSNGSWDSCVGAIVPSAETCDAIDNDCDKAIDETCEMTDAPPPSATLDPPSRDPLTEMNEGCRNGDFAGSDPIHLGTKSAVTEPFTDLEVTVLRTVGVTRSYTSGDVMAGGGAGIFGLGWQHNWETTLTCAAKDGVNGKECTIKTSLGEAMHFVKQTDPVTGVGALAGESLVLYRRTEPENLAAGGYNLMVRRPAGEFVLFQLDGSELHFLEPASCTGTYCLDEGYNGTLRLTRDVDPMGRGVQLDFTASGKLLTLVDDLGNRMSIAPSSSCAGRAGAVAYRAGTSGDESTYVTYEYDSTCATLTKVVPSNYTPAPGKTAQLRRYEYQSTPRAGLLTTVRNEQDDPITVFGYDNSTGNATQLVDAQSSLTVTYPQANEDVVTSAYGTLQAQRTTYRDGSAKATAVADVSGLTTTFEEFYTTGQENMKWNGRYLVCSESQGVTQTVRYFQRDTHNRVTKVADYGWTAPYAIQVFCRDTPWTTGSTPLRATYFEYGAVKTIAQGVTMPLQAATKTYQASVFAASVSGATTSQTLDYDPAAKAGDPSGYSCGTSNLPVGGLVCRRLVEGYTWDANNQPTLQKVATFYSYDARGRVVKIEGPLYIVGTGPAGNIDPVEARTYWPDDDADVLRRGRLRDVKRWPSGYPDAARALVTTNQLYDVFGPTQVIDESNETIVYSRAGGAGRVTRIDTPDSRHVVTRYYDAQEPRLVILNGGSARRFTYDDKGRLHLIEPVSDDPDAGPVTVGWTESREYDAAGNTTLTTRKDSTGAVRWKQAFEHYPNGELRRMPHPSSTKYARWTRYPNGVARFYWDEDQHITETFPDALGRTRGIEYKYWSGSYVLSVGGGYWYEYEPGQDAIRTVYAATTSTGTPDGRLPVIASYVHDDFGQVLSVASPYTLTAGPYVYQYDARGNAVKRTGGGTELAWQHDGLNRLTQMTAKRLADNSTLSYSYTYDDPAARGRLRAIVEGERTTTFVYDEMGRPRFEILAESGVTAQLSTEYIYDPDGMLSEIVTPSGLAVKYERDPVTKDVTEVRNKAPGGTTYAMNIKHLPSGPITDLTFPGGATLSQGFNLRYEPIAIASGPLQLSYTITEAGLAKTIGAVSYTYDKRDRLERATPSHTRTMALVYPYDSGTTWLAVNDRPQHALGETGKKTYAFGYDDGSNMSAISTYDGWGTYITSTTCLVHDALGRLTAMGPAKVLAGADARACKSENDLSTVTVRFQYDARNRRVARRDGAGPWKQYVFRPDGIPIAELTRPGTSGGSWSFQREYVWLDGRPLAQIEYPGPAGGNEGYVYLVHVDHLGQPRALSATAGATVWSASPPRPYGDMTETSATDPANGRTVATNLRAPGQYDERLFAAAGINGLHGPYYNWNRWYMPGAGRYLEADPVAILGRFNTPFGVDWYGYSLQNPLRYVDQDALLPLDGGSVDRWLITTQIWVSDCNTLGGSACVPVYTAWAVAGLAAVASAGWVAAESLWASPTAIPAVQKLGAQCPVTGYRFHGLAQAMGRDGVGVSAQAILDTIRSPILKIPQPNGTMRYVGQYAVVVLNGAGQVVTTWATSSNAWRIR